MDSAETTTVAIALVVDSSFSTLQHWANLLIRYVSPIIKRVSESYPATPYSLAFVTYGPADAVPSPILCRNFFQDSPTVIKGMREDPTKSFHLGSTNAGGSKGMATLEGLVAAVELFDGLLKARDSKNHRPPVFHLVHISTSIPDDSVHPHWNELSELDETTWDKLSSELSSRDINFSSIVLNSKNSKCADLHASFPPAKTVAPWFPVEQNHSVLLSGFNLSKGVKRPGDSSVAPDPKKLRSAPSPITNSSPSMKPGTTPANPPQPQPQPPAAPAFFPGTTYPLSKLPPQLLNIYTQFCALEEVLKRLAGMLQETVSTGQGQSERASQLKEEIMKKGQPYQKLKATMVQVAQRLNQQQVPNNGSSVQQSAGAAPGNQVAGSTQSSPPVHMKPGISPKPDSARPLPLPATEGTNGPSNNSQTLHSRTPSNADASQNPPAGNSSALSATIPGQPKMMSPDVKTQMQKLVEQSERSGRIPAGGQMSNMNAAQTQNTPNLPSQPLNPPSDASGAMGSNMSPVPSVSRPPGVVGGQPAQASNPLLKGPPVWQGLLSLPLDPQIGRQELKVQVAMYASQQHLSTAQSETWPPMMQLNVTRDRLVNMFEFQLWLKQTKAVLCMVQPANRENELNTKSFRLLLEFITKNQCYAAAGWTTPNGSQRNNAIFFPMSGQLGAALCPMNGIPEMPRSMTEAQRQALTARLMAGNSSNNPTLANRPGPGMMPGPQQGLGGGGRPGMPPAQLGHPSQQPSHTMLGNPGAMNAFMGRMGANGMPMRPNMGAGMNFPGQNMMMNNLVRSAGLAGVGIGSSGMPGNLSPEIMQSFMQRNAEAGNNGQGGMG